MIKIQIALVCGVVAAGIGLSLLLLPGDMELALINLNLLILESHPAMRRR